MQGMPSVIYISQKLSHYHSTFLYSRMTGGGFGGCAVLLVQQKYLQSIEDHIRSSYLSRFEFEPTFVASSAAGGAIVYSHES